MRKKEMRERGKEEDSKQGLIPVILVFSLPSRDSIRITIEECIFLLCVCSNSSIPSLLSLSPSE